MRLLRNGWRELVCLCMGPLLRGQDHRLPPGPRGVLGGMRCAAWPLWRLEVVLQRRLLLPSIAQTNRGATRLLPDRLGCVANPTARQVLWEAYGEQSTRWFYDLMPRDLQESEAAGGTTSVRVGHPGGAASTVHCVHDVGGTAKVGDLLSATSLPLGDLGLP